MTEFDNLIIGFVGAGNMARAVGEGVIKKGLIKKENIIVSAPSNRNLVEWEKLGVSTTNSNGFLVSKCDIIILACKPYQLDTALKGVSSTFPSSTDTNRLFVSVIAGATLESLLKKLQGCGMTNARVVRVIPNTPSTVGAGCAVFTPHVTASEHDIHNIETIFSTLGKCVKIPENLMGAAGGLMASGPAFIYMVIEALSDGGVKQGIPRDVSTLLAAQMVLGSAKMVLDTGKHPGLLKDEVCSPGGTTICGVHALERGGMRSAFIDAVEAATKRAEEIRKMNE